MERVISKLNKNNIYCNIGCTRLITLIPIIALEQKKNVDALNNSDSKV